MRITKKKSRDCGLSKRKKSVSLVEVLVASALSAFVTISSVASVIYYQRVSAMNHRLAMVGNLIESEMEYIKNQTWYTLGNSDDGLFNPDPDDERDGGWPAPGEDTFRAPLYDPPIRTVSDLPPVEYEDQFVDGLFDNFNGIDAILEVFYTPIVITHEAEGDAGVVLEYDVRYWKVEIVVTLEGSQRIRFTGDMDPDRDGIQDVWSTVTYISELAGRGDAEFSIRNLQKLRERQRLAD